MDLFDLLAEVRRAPATISAVVTEAACAIGIDTYPKIYATVKKGEAGAWELVNVSIDPALLPEAGAGEFLLVGQLDTPRK